MLVAASLLMLPGATTADRKPKQPMTRHSKAKPFVAYAYTATGNLTFLGEEPVAGKTIAADPEVLPLGTRVKISGAGSYSGEYVVGDIGGKIKGHVVDIFMDSHQEAIEFGRQKVSIAVVKSAPATGTRARKAEPIARNSCRGCGRKEPAAMIAIDEAPGSSGGAARNVAARKPGDRLGPRDSREGGSSPAVARLSAFQRTSAH